MSSGFFRLVSGCIALGCVLCCALIIETTEPGTFNNAFVTLAHPTQPLVPLTLDGTVR